MATTQQIIDRHDQYMTHNFSRYPIVIAEAAGCVLTDEEGKQYLDLFSGFGAGILGHCHTDLVTAGIKQMNKLWHVGNLLHTEPQTLLAEQISKKGFGGKSFFCHSGADANEGAIKLARLFGKQNRGESKHEFGRFKVISATQSFHGRSFATMGATGNAAVRQGFEPLLPGFVNVTYNDIAAVEAELDETAIAIIVEPIQGEGGINVPDDGYLAKLRKICDQRNMLLIFDEVWTGCGRTGQYFAHQHWNVKPDVMTLGKAVGCGLPVGVVCAGPRAWDMFDNTKMGRTTHATTLGGNCVAMAVSARMFEVLERDELLPRATQAGEQIKARLRKFSEKHAVIRDVRGKGLFIGVELDASVKGAWFKSGNEVVSKCLDRGVLMNCTHDTVLRLAPPLVISDEEIERGLDVLEKVLVGK